MTITLSIIAGLAVTLVSLLARPTIASAHCDTVDGPAVADGERALRTGNVNIAAKWVQPDNDAELRMIFAQAHAIRDRGDDVRAVADRWFLENLVRIHRAGEGAPYTGLKPVATQPDRKVRAADEAVATGALGQLETLVPQDQVPELERRLTRVLALRDHDVDDVEAGRTYLDAYVSFVKLAEGHSHEHHAHAHATGQPA